MVNFKINHILDNRYNQLLRPMKNLNVKPRVTSEACHRLALNEGQNENNEK